MDEKEIKRRYQEGRAFLKYGSHDEFSDFQSDQQLKKPQPPLVKAPMREEKIQLPMDFSELDLNMNLTDILVARKSNRVFTEDKMTVTQLSYLLWATQGIKDIRGKSYATLRTVPSGGARHPFETYLMVQKVEGLEPGRYHYLPMGHALEYLGPCEDMKQVITDSLVGQSWAAKSAVVFYWSFVPYRSEWRYGINAHRPVLIDMGHVGENLYLACAALHLGDCGLAAFDMDVCDEQFELDGDNEYVVYTSAVGCVDPKDIAAENAFYAFVEEEGL